jgi:nucleoside-diphosphate-sugar epimerase
VEKNWLGMVLFRGEGKMKIKVAIVGASGALGLNLIAQFQQAGRAVRALVRNQKKVKWLLQGESEALWCDLLTIPPSLLTEQLKGCDVVVHAATEIPLQAQHVKDWETNNRLRMEGTSRLIDSSLRAGVRLYLQAGTISAYVHGGEKWLDEATPFDIIPTRAVETLAVADMERRVREIPSDRLNWAILRLGNLIGSGTLQDLLIRDLWVGRVLMPGDGNHFISPVSVVDAAEDFVKASQRPVRQGVFNIVDEPIRYNDYLEILSDRLGAPRPRREWSPQKSLSHRCSNEVARKELGWAPGWGLHSGKRMMVGA